MKISFLLPICVALSWTFSALPMQAGGPKDPALRAKETREQGQAFLREAEELTKRAAEATGTAARDLEKFAALTAQEGKHLLEASEAWSKKQVRRAERAEKKAAEICAERGAMIEKVYPPHEKKAKEGQSDAVKPLEKNQSPSLPPEKMGPKGEKLAPALEKPAPIIKPGKDSTQSALENLQEQAEQLGGN